LFGKDVTIEDFLGEETFFGGGSRAGKLTTDMLSRLHQYEHGFGEQLDTPWLKEQFPFIDLYRWIGKGGAETNIEFVREYFEATKLRIVVTFSHLVSSWTASNFVHQYGLPTYCLRLLS